MKSWLLPIALLSLTGCATDSSSAFWGETAQVAGAQIALKTYSAGFQTRLAEEVEQAPADAAMTIAVTDYGQLRRGVCAARGWQGGPCPTMKAGATPR